MTFVPDEAMLERVKFAQSGDSLTRAALRKEGLLELASQNSLEMASGGDAPRTASELFTSTLPVSWPQKVPDGRGRLVQLRTCHRRRHPLLSISAAVPCRSGRSHCGKNTGSIAIPAYHGIPCF